jgi:hypothetical protein
MPYRWRLQSDYGNLPDIRINFTGQGEAALQ